MYIKKYLVGYILLTVCLPATVFLGNMVGTSMLKAAVAVVLVLCAIINYFYSGKIIKYIFGNRGHNKVDINFVSGVILGVVLLFFLRHIATCLMGFSQIPRFIIYFIMSPLIILVAAPFMKNYCINVNTIRVSIVCTFLIMFVAMPMIIKAISLASPGNNFMLEVTYNKYFIHESTANLWVMNMLEYFKLSVSDTVLLMILNAMKLVIWGITFLPYLVINCVITDELTYMEFCKKLTGLNIMTLCVTVVGIALVCCVLANKGQIDILYGLKHY